MYMGQSIQEWAKRNLWTAFKKFEKMWSAKQTISLQIFYRLYFTYFLQTS